MADERDAKLILRAEDRATKTFDAVSKSIANVRKELQEQAKAAEAGQGSLADLQASLKAYKDLGDDLIRQQGAVKAFERAGEASEKVAGRVAKATKALDDYRNTLAGQEQLTESQSTKLDRLAANVEKAVAAQNKQAVSLKNARDQLEAFGLSADRTAEQYDQIAGSAREVAQGLAIAKRSVDSFDESTQRSSVAVGKLAEQQRFLNDILRGGGTSAFSSAAAESAGLLQKQREETEKTALAFRKVASDAAAAAGDLGRFGTTATEANASVTRLADSIRQTIAPAVAEVQTLDGALRQVEESSNLAADGQKKRSSIYQDSLNKLSQAQAAFVRQATQVEAYRTQQRALQGLEVDLGAAALKVERLAAELATVPANAEAVARELAQARRELESVGKTTQDARTRFEELGNSLKRVGVNIDDLDGEFRRLETGAKRSAVAADTLTTKVGGNGKGFLGLKGYELQNLSYQVNDVFTSLASGIPVTQTLAQQGPQIIQIFPGILTGALKLLPVLAPIAAGIGLVAYNLYQTKKAADATKGFEQSFTLSGNAAGYSAKQFADAQLQLEGLGNKAEAAKDALREFIRAGLDPSSLSAFVTTANTVAQVTGEALPQAAEKLAAAYAGGYKQISDLNDLLGGPLNAAELQEIQNLFDAGKAEEARTRAKSDFETAAQRVADKSKSEWSQATEKLGQAFSRLNAALGASEGASAVAKRAIQGVIDILDRVSDAANLAADAYAKFNRFRAQSNAASETRFGLTGDYKEALKQNYVAAGLNPDGSVIVAKAPKVEPRKRDPNAPTTGGRELLRQQQTELKNAKLLTAEERLRTAETDARNKAAAAGASNAEVAQAALNARKIEQAKIDKEGATSARQAESAAAKAAREAESRQSRINALTADLRNTFLTFATVGKDDPFQKIQNDAEKAVNTIRQKFDALGKLGVTKVDGKTRADFEAQVAGYAAIQTRLETQKKQEQDLNDLLEQRKLRLAAIEDAVKAKEINPLEGVAQSQVVVDDLQPKLTALIQQALAFNTALRTATYDPKLEAFISKLQGQLRDVAGGDEIKAALDGALKDAQTNLAAIVSQRDEYVKVQNALVNAGLKTSTDAQQAIQREYDATRPKILAAADAVQLVIEKQLALKQISKEAADALIGALNVTRGETGKLDADIVALKQAAEQALSGAINDFIVNLGTQIAGVLDGTSSLKDALSGIAGAALSFAASFTKAIAQAIIQLIALKIAKQALAAVGFGLHTGGIAGVGQATFKRKVPSEVFAGAVRYHTGGVAGLLPNEVPAILEKGEEVLTRDDPRHRANGGASPSAAPVTIKNINLFDAGEAVSQGANTTAGERAIMNVVQRNKQALGLGS